MTKVIVSGSMGHMGRILCSLIEKSADFTLAAGVDPMGTGEILPSLENFTGEAELIIDFSHHTAVVPLLQWAVAHRVPVLVATTGHDAAEQEAIRAAAKEIPVF